MSPEPIGTELEVCKDIASRQQKGIAKYGKTVRENKLSLRQWLNHAYEECLDQAIYLKRTMEEMDAVHGPDGEEGPDGVDSGQAGFPGDCLRWNPSTQRYEPYVFTHHGS